MSNAYYKACPEFDRYNELIEKYWNTKQFEKCFEGHMELAEKGYPLAECQVGYFFYDGIGVEKDADKAFYWTQRAAEHGDRDGQFNLAYFYEEGIGTPVNMEKAKHWYKKAAEQNHDLAIQKCQDLNLGDEYRARLTLPRTSTLVRGFMLPYKNPAAENSAAGRLRANLDVSDVLVCKEEQRQRTGANV